MQELPIGLLPDSHYASARTSYYSGDLFIILTDGLVEARDNLLIVALMGIVGNNFLVCRKPDLHEAVPMRDRWSFQATRSWLTCQSAGYPPAVDPF